MSTTANKKLYIAIHVFYLMGLLAFTLSHLFRHSLTDFQFGFCEGFSIIAMLVGFIYIIWNLIHNRKPFRL